MDSGNGLAEKISELMRAAGDPSYETVAREIRAAGGPTVSAAYLWQLRTGARENPTFQHLQALTRYFSLKLDLPITLQYFDPQTPVDQPWTDAQAAALRASETHDDQEELTRQLADLGVRRISARYGEMGSNILRDVLAVMDKLAAQQEDGAQPSTDAPPPRRGGEPSP